MSLWDSGIISASYTGDPGFQFCNFPLDFKFLFVTENMSVKTFGENCIENNGKEFLMIMKEMRQDI